jgi:hypothetical protein
MKSNFLKIGMPIMAFMLAIVFAFASEKTKVKNESLVTGYIFKDGMCQSVPQDCNNIQGDLCEYFDVSTGLNFQIYEIIDGTTCYEELYHRK